MKGNQSGGPHPSWRLPYCGWTKCNSHHFETMVETVVCWYLQDNHQKPGFLRWCDMAMGQNPNRTPSEHPIQFPLKSVLKWVVHLPKLGSGHNDFDPQPYSALAIGVRVPAAAAPSAR